jgi:lysine 2,3-aminomutase
MCNRDCDNCNLDLQLTETDESVAIGIEKLLSDTDDTISLIPEDNERFLRREEDAG